MSTSLPLLLVVGVLVMAACVGDDPAVQGGSSGTVTGPDGGGGTTNDGAASGGDSATGTDSSTPSCACVDTGASLLCGATKTACGDYGCAEATAETAAHCRRFDPTGLVEPTDLIVAGLKDYTGKNLKSPNTGQTSPHHKIENRLTDQSESKAQQTMHGWP